VSLSAYFPQDRLRAIATNTSLPDRTSGLALFADISGFTALTESLQMEFGSRRGSEELSRHLEAGYSALITEIEKYGGSVISFAGDSMLCWFDGENDDGRMQDEGYMRASSYALSAAMEMQEAIKEFPVLGLKISIASGDARRFIVGNEDIQRIDILAGKTVARTATGERLASECEVLVDEVTANELGDSVVIKEWREDNESGERFAVISRINGKSQPVVGNNQSGIAGNSVLKSFVLQEVYERETSEQGDFLTEFRPCVALFVRFTGIDYDSDSAEEELDHFIREVQTVATRYEGTFLDITIGDKGSYVHVNFGVLSVHEDDSRRAVKTALELRNKTDLQLQMGITQGLMRVGAYGGETRKVFGALGDDVNLAARLMMTAKEDEILLSSHVHKAVMDQFTFEPRPPLPMKGRAEPLPVFAVTGESLRRAVRLQEPNYSLPMVGREKELAMINEKMSKVLEGKSQVIGIVAEAGLGKSRLVAEVIRSARKMGFVGFGGVCQSDGIHTPYLAWKSIWQAFFDVDPEMSERKLIRRLEGEIEDRAPSRLDAMPLLNVVLDLNIPENDFTKNLEPRIRQSALHALLEDCLKSAAGRDAVSMSNRDEKGEMTSPLLIVIEDLHWIDALSYDLLEGLAKSLTHHAVCFVLAYRPPELERLQASHIEALEQFTRIELSELTKAEAESAIRAKLTQLYPARGGALPAGLVDALMERAQGNPFYLEELLNYLHDRGIDPSEIDKIELPDSMHTLILSRIDQLSEGEKTTLRVASIVGRLFRAKWLTGYYPELGSFPQVKSALDALEALEITPLDTPEPELAYLFKHIVTHEVTYESLPFATRARLHEQLARYLENEIQVGETQRVQKGYILPLLDVIAFHYGRSENQEKQVEYLRMAGEAAQKNYANDAALAHYGQILPLLKDANEQAQIHLKRGQVLEFMGKWDEAEIDYRAALNSAKEDMTIKTNAQVALGKLNRLRGEYETALDWLGQAMEARTKLEDSTGLAQVLIETGLVFLRKGEYGQVRELMNKGLALAREANDKSNTALALNALGNVISDQGDFAAARTFYEESLALRREMGDKAGIAGSLNNLGIAAINRGDYTVARAFYEESLALVREIGDKKGITSALNNLGGVAYEQGDSTAARAFFEESLVLKREMGDKRGIAMSLNNLGSLVQTQGDYATARGLYEECLMLCKEMDDKSTMAYVLFGLGLVDLAEGKPESHENILGSLRLRQETGEQVQQTSSLIGAAGSALQEGDVQFAAELLGAVGSALKALNAVVEPELKPFHSKLLAKLKEELGEAAFQSAWEKGANWNLAEAVKRVLDQ